jgi:hypothetical protein
MFASWPARRNYRCDLSSTGEDGVVHPFIYNLTEDFAVSVWVGSITHSGYSYPTQPYPVWLKATVHRLPSSCAAINPYTVDVRNGGSLYDSGITAIKFGLVDYEYAWPPLCYAGDIYDY